MYEVIPADRHGDLTDKKWYAFQPKKKLNVSKGNINYTILKKG